MKSRPFGHFRKPTTSPRHNHTWTIAALSRRRAESTGAASSSEKSSRGAVLRSRRVAYSLVCCGVMNEGPVKQAGGNGVAHCHPSGSRSCDDRQESLLAESDVNLDAKSKMELRKAPHRKSVGLLLSSLSSSECILSEHCLLTGVVCGSSSSVTSSKAFTVA